MPWPPPQQEEMQPYLPPNFSSCFIAKIVIRDTDFKRSPSMKILRNQK